MIIKTAVHKGIKLPFKIGNNGRIYDESRSFYLVRTNKSVYIRNRYRTKTEFKSSYPYFVVLLETFLNIEYSGNTMTIKYKDGDETNLALDNIEIIKKETKASVKDTRKLEISRRNVELFLSLGCSPKSDINRAMEVSKVDKKQAHDILYGKMYNAVRTGYNIRLAKTRFEECK